MSKITEWSSAIKENKWLVLLIIGFFTSAAGNVYQATPVVSPKSVTHKEASPTKVIERTIIKNDCKALEDHKRVDHGYK